MGCEFYIPYIGKLFNHISHVREFEKDLKKFVRRFPSLEEDLQTFVKVALSAFHKQKIDSKGIFPIPDLGVSCPRIYKARKFACRSLKGKGVQSGIRIIYAYYEEQDRIEFVEIYYKGDMENEDRERIQRYYK